MIKKVELTKFKQYKKKSIKLTPNSLTILAGGNNSGKSTLLHSIAVWEFCKLILTIEKGASYLSQEYHGQGLGISADEFLPIALPSLKHLWTNLKTQKDKDDQDGYNLKIKCYWDIDSSEKFLEISLSLANDRLFIKTTESNVEDGDKIPTAAYLPTFAGILERENKVSQAERRKFIGKGLAGSVLRNLLLDLSDNNKKERARLKGDGSKIKQAALKTLRESDPYELLLSNIRNTFGRDLRITDFNDLYHTAIRIDCFKGQFTESKRFRKISIYNYRDLMVEGSGFLQWLNVFTLTLSPDIDIILLDEPDAHLHPSLQMKMISELKDINSSSSKQILIATHSTEIITESSPTSILNLNTTRYLQEDSQKVGLLAGLGSEYSPLLHKLKSNKKIIFVEGEFDFIVLKRISELIGEPISDNITPWVTASSHKQRNFLFDELKKEMPELKAISLRDRDDENINTVDEDLKDKIFGDNNKMKSYKWKRRNIENYLFSVPDIANICKIEENLIHTHLSNSFALSIPETYKAHSVPDAIALIDGKKILSQGEDSICKTFSTNKYDILKGLTRENICDDLITMVRVINEELN